jgi:HSP20 family molecular chaperone IbpA
VAELVDWFDSGWPTFAEWRRGVSGLRIEDQMKDGSYVVRAELPGVDPDKDVAIQLENGVLTVSAERHESTADKGRSEFRYGAFRRSVTLPPGAQEDQVKATYRDGILEVTVPVDLNRSRTRTVAIARENGHTAIDATASADAAKAAPDASDNGATTKAG